MIVLELIITVVVFAIGLRVCYESCLMIEEKKQRQRKGLTDYYDNPIDKERN